METPLLLRTWRKRQESTISASAMWAMTSATDHFPGAGRRVSCFLFLPLSSAANFLGAATCRRRGSLPSERLNMRCVYCWGVSCIHFSEAVVHGHLTEIEACSADAQF